MTQYDLFSTVARSPLGQLVLFGFVWSLAYHLLNGIRHLAWDVGYGFNVHTANRTGVLVFTLSIFVAIARVRLCLCLERRAPMSDAIARRARRRPGRRP